MKMRSFIQNKLWRSKAKILLEQQGSIIHTKQLTHDEYDTQLRLKLIEEAQEICAAQSSDEIVQELADVFEVIDAIIALHALNKNKILAAQEKKYNERGGFSADAYITIAQHQQGSFGERYCLNQPEKYPEIID